MPKLSDEVVQEVFDCVLSLMVKMLRLLCRKHNISLTNNSYYLNFLSGNFVYSGTFELVLLQGKDWLFIPSPMTMGVEEDDQSHIV